LVKFLLFSFFISSLAIGQTDIIFVKKRKNIFPILAGIQTGEIPYYLLCDSAGIWVRRGLEVTSFEVSYWKGRGMTTVQVQGNTLPDSICTQIGIYSLGNAVFLNEICAFDNLEKMYVSAHSMSLTPIKKEDE
jgi:hypothetical protein